VTVDNGRSGAWVSLKDAARQLGLSDKTIRRRVKAGTLQGRQAPTPHGPAWQVWVDTAGTLDGEGTRSVRGPELLEALRLVRDQQQTIMELSGRVGYLQAELTQARERILILEAPKTEPADMEPTAAVETASEPSTRRWWRRGWWWVRV
jgi:AraC-like DNA-binding protein